MKAVMRRYAWSLDMNDWERLEACFTEDILFEASDVRRHVGARHLIQRFQSRVVRNPVRRHAIYNPYVFVTGDRAEFTSYNVNTRFRPNAPGGDFFMAGGYYSNTFIRSNGQWKLSHLRWHGFFAEGNPRMDPSIVSLPSEPVMSGPADAPWGGAAAGVPQSQQSAALQIRNLMTGLMRAGDAKVRKDVAAAFIADATANLVGQGSIAGPDAIAATFCPADNDGWTIHVLSNEKVSVVGDVARYGAYVYRASSAGKKVAHSGGVLVATIKRTGAGWRIHALCNSFPVGEGKGPIRGSASKPTGYRGTCERHVER